MNKNRREGAAKKIAIRSAKEVAFPSVFVALTIGAQAVFAAVPGVELVTVLFVCYAFSFGVRRGIIAATAFSLLRCLVFGFTPTVIILYLIYYNLLAVVFGFVGFWAKGREGWQRFVFLAVPLACVCTVFFTLLDCVITPVWYRFTVGAAKAYFIASLPFMIPQVVFAGVSVGVLFVPLSGAFLLSARFLNKR
ncbi:MAG: hypothetical protein IJY62_06560 [Clostridia bacterium]|nr:hypothetical protein [Clostridia bacterium]